MRVYVRGEAGNFWVKPQKKHADSLKKAIKMKMENNTGERVNYHKIALYDNLMQEQLVGDDELQPNSVYIYFCDIGCAC